jgi:hypothetical protein
MVRIFFGSSGINKAFVVYSLSDDVLKKIEQGGLNYLQGIESTIKYKELQSNYEKNISQIDYKGSEKNPNFTPKDRSEKFMEENRLRHEYRGNAIGMYKDWRSTPVPDNWGHKNDDRNTTSCMDTSIFSYYGDLISIPPSFKNKEVLKNKTLADLNFTDEIKPEYIQMVNKIINSPDSYYAYGEFGVLIISPAQRKMFLLYRA